jgi:hypothetical protein
MAANGRILAGYAGFALLVVLIMAGCATTKSGAAGDEDLRIQALEKQLAPSYQMRRRTIPPEYMPPPGKCRIWFPSRPPEDQPPPGECAVLERHLPLNTWLLHGAKE